MKVAHYDYEAFHMADAPGGFDQAGAADADHDAVADRPLLV